MNNGTMIKTLLLFLILNTLLFAQEYRIHHYTIEDGLPSNEVYDIGQDSVGIMWFATRKGLCKYDGFHWYIDTTISTPNNFIPNFLKFDPNGTPWLCAKRLTAGIYFKRQHQWEHLKFPDSLHIFPEVRFFSVILDSLKQPFLLVVTHKNHIIYYYQQQWKKLPVSFSSPFRVLAVDRLNHYFLILTNTGLYRFDGKQLVAVPLPQKISGQPLLAFRVLTADIPGSNPKISLFLTARYLYKWTSDSLVAIALPQNFKKQLADLPISLLDDGAGGIYLGNKFKLVHYNIFLKKWELITFHSVPKNIDAMALFLDQEKNLWISSYMGLFKISTLRFLNFDEFSGMLETEVSAIAQFKSGELLLGHDNGFTLFDGTNFRRVLIGTITAPTEQSSKRFIQMQPAKDNTILVAAQNLGLLRIFSNGRYEVYPPPQGGSINALIRLNKDEWLVGTYRGLFTFSKGQYRPYWRATTNRLLIRRILRTPQGDLLLATIWNGVVRIDSTGKSTKIWNPHYPKSRSVYDLKISPQGNFLVATKAGLFELRGQQLQPFANSLLHQEIYAILFTRHNTTWLGTAHGVLILHSNGSIDHYDYFNGLAGQECNRDALFEDRSGKIWIGTNGGLSLYQPPYDIKVRPPVIKLNSLIPSGNYLKHAEHKGDFVVRFLCLSFKDERHIQFRYRLIGYHDWKYVPRLFTPVLPFMDVPPGTYHLELQARNVEGTWSPIVSSQPFTIPVPFYHSWYFIALTIFAVLVIFYLMILALVKDRLAKKLEDEVEKRTRELRQSEEKYRRLFTDSQDGIFITSIDGKILDVNEAGIKIMGYSSKEEIANLNLPNDIYANPKDREKFLNLIREKGYARNFELKVKRKDGKIIVVAISATPLYNEKGEIIGFSGYFRDMTEWNAMKEQLAHSQRMESLGMLAGGVAHDFNNILAGILGYASLLKMKINPKDKIFRYIDIIEKSAQRAAGLTQQLLIFSRKGQPKLQPVNLNDCVNESIKLIKSTFPRTIEIETELDDAIPEILADPTQLSQMIINLAVNARDAMPDGEGKITFKTEEVVIENPEDFNNPDVTAGRFVCLSIADTGTGIPDDVKNKIFEPFFTTKPRGKGTGMGLAMVYGFVRNLGGFILLQTQLNQGTTFRIHFPVQPIHAHSKHADDNTKIKTGTERILVVDDEEMVRSFCKMALEKYGYSVELAANGKQALALFKKHHQNFDLMILDMIMPVMDGMKTYQKIRKINRDLKILISSGYSDSDKLETLKQDPKVALILKPFRVQDLVTKVRELLDQN